MRHPSILTPPFPIPPGTAGLPPVGYAERAVSSLEGGTRIPLMIWAFLIYLGAITVFGKGPTYLFVPPFIWGEMTLVVVALWTFLNLTHQAWNLFFGKLGLCVAGFFCVGAFRLLLSIQESGWNMDAVRDSMIWYYALFFFFGITLATRVPLANATWVWIQRFWILTVIWMVCLFFTQGRIIHMSPNTWRGIPLLLHSTSDVLQQMSLGILLLLMYNPKDLRRGPLYSLFMIGVLLVAAHSLFTAQGRGVKIAVLGGIFLGVLASFRTPVRIWSFSRYAVIGLVLLMLLGIGAILYGPAGLRQDIGRRARLDRFTEIRAGEQEASTARWRTVWWQNIHEHVQQTHPLLGIGFGRNLSDFNPFIVDDGDPHPVRSPHNINMTIYARMGILGGLLWFLILLLGFAPLFFRLRRGGFFHWEQGYRQYTPERYRELFLLLVFLIATWINSSFAVLMEGPVLGIWFWFALGYVHARMGDLSGTIATPPADPFVFP